MAPHIPHPPSLVPLLLLSVTLLIGHVTGQGVHNNEVPGHPEDALEDTVIAEILRTVDQKFDSLSARISGLERSVNSLNFYSVRQFRDISDGLESSAAAVHSLRTQLTKADKDNRALKVAVTQTSRSLNAIRTDVGAVKSDVKVVKGEVGTTKEEVEALKSDSLKMFEDIANSIVYFNENTGERTEQLKASLTQAVSLAEERQASERQEDSAVILSYLHDVDLHAPRNCNVNFRPLEERIDLRFAEMKRQTHIHFVDLINTAPHRQEEEEGQDQDREKQSPPVSEAPGPLRPVAQAGAEGAAAVGEGGGGEGGGGRGGEGERVMRLLANMTQNVMEAVSFLRHSGSMMERLLHASFTIKDEQSRLRQELEAGRLLSSGHGAEMSLDSLVSSLPQEGPLPSLPHLLPPNLSPRPQEVDSSSELGEPVHRLPASGHLSEKTRPDDHHPPRFGSSSSSPLAGSRGAEGGESSLPSGGGVSMRGVAEESLHVLSELTRNGSQLLEVMTDLAQLSSSSLSRSLADLRDQVLRLQHLRSTLRQDGSSPAPTARPSGDLSADAEASSPPEGGGGELRVLQNTTKTMFSIVEAIASNTGWIPYIFHNMQHVERLTNRTLQLTQRALAARHRGPVRGRGAGEGPRGGGDGGRWGPDEGRVLQAMYRTSVQLQRILPALTKLVAEPEPLMALAEGGSSHEGQVEIFHRGHWGAVCRLDMGHAEASAVCQYLGFAGGVWAGAGHFEREGGGRHWLLNVSCVFSQACPVVTPVNRTVDCPSGHFAVICDHMLRMTPIPGISDVKTGLVSIHHQGRWLPVCSHGWSGYEARVACKQMGFLDGREFLRDGMPWREVLGEVRRWVAGVGCTGEEGRLDACDVDTYSAEECSETNTPAAVRCQ